MSVIPSDTRLETEAPLGRLRAGVHRVRLGSARLVQSGGLAGLGGVCVVLAGVLTLVTG